MKNVAKLLKASFDLEYWLAKIMVRRRSQKVSHIFIWIKWYLTCYILAFSHQLHSAFGFILFNFISFVFGFAIRFIMGWANIWADRVVTTFANNWSVANVDRLVKWLQKENRESSYHIISVRSITFCIQNSHIQFKIFWISNVKFELYIYMIVK